MESEPWVICVTSQFNARLPRSNNSLHKIDRNNSLRCRSGQGASSRSLVVGNFILAARFPNRCFGCGTGISSFPGSHWFLLPHNYHKLWRHTPLWQFFLRATVFDDMVDVFCFQYGRRPAFFAGCTLVGINSFLPFTVYYGSHAEIYGLLLYSLHFIFILYILPIFCCLSTMSVLSSAVLLCIYIVVVRIYLYIFVVPLQYYC